MVGRAMALDLSNQHEVTSFDISESNLASLKARNPQINTLVSDLKDFGSYGNLLQPFDLVVTAVPGFMGYAALEAVIRSGKSVADISFFPKTPSNWMPLPKKIM